MENSLFVLVPTHPRACSEGLCNPWNRGQGSQRKLKRPGQIGRTVLMRERKSLLFCQVELVRSCVVRYIAPGCLRCQPFAQIALIGSSLGSEFSSCHRTGG